MPQDPWNDNHNFGRRMPEPSWEQVDEHGNVVADSNFPNGFPDAECAECFDGIVEEESKKNAEGEPICDDCAEDLENA